MMDTILDANFPRTPDGKVYHLGIRSGQVANRILTVGSPSRAEAISRLLDQDEHTEHHGDVHKPAPAVLRIASERGFLTFTGRFRGVPVSIISIGMGYPNMDFFVREVRECVNGDLVIIRLGSCGGLNVNHPVGTLVVPRASVAIHRNYDYDFLSDSQDGNSEPPYMISKPVSADTELHAHLAKKLKSAVPLDPPAVIVDDTINATADSFYSSQGRITSFPDHNETLIDDVVKKVPGVASLEMETFQLLHLASVWRPRTIKSLPSFSDADSQTLSKKHTSGSVPRIRAAAVQMIFAQRRSQDFISPSRVAALQDWTGRVVLEALTEFHIPEEIFMQMQRAWVFRKGRR